MLLLLLLLEKAEGVGGRRKKEKCRRKGKPGTAGEKKAWETGHLVQYEKHRMEKQRTKRKRSKYRHCEGAKKRVV